MRNSSQFCAISIILCFFLCVCVLVFAENIVRLQISGCNVTIPFFVAQCIEIFMINRFYIFNFNFFGRKLSKANVFSEVLHNFKTFLNMSLQA